MVSDNLFNYYGRVGDYIKLGNHILHFDTKTNFFADPKLKLSEIVPIWRAISFVLPERKLNFWTDPICRVCLKINESETKLRLDHESTKQPLFSAEIFEYCEINSYTLHVKKPTAKEDFLTHLKRAYWEL